MNRDTKISQAQSALDEKISKVDKTLDKAYKLKTNQVLEYNGKRYHLLTADVDTLRKVYVHLLVFSKEWYNTFPDQELKIGSYLAMHWMEDVKYRIDQALAKAAKKKLSKARKEMENYLSDETKEDKALKALFEGVGLEY